MGIKTHQYTGINNQDAECGIDIINSSDKIVIVISQLVNEASVTNNIENIINSLVTRYKPDLERTSFVEHYPTKKSYDLVGFTVKNGKVVDVTWDTLREIDLVSLGIKK
ncbi:hypothetical protein BBD42_21550 [Paenibacillus sp. BIHB 4019]|uniref:Uncharacterized protein n=1 Tax=Paenibacillus sp. BIHB 4019 TaxID=1870819 RepID=A0A1B2DM29_9BACL|nr:hypothetical protein [Paenibacillus sp. BIHB 4019]ANY68762.1 hypothetical protein BBD42_21550 [Paenibacillus sp. BIHB 4019]